jgi:hypothetical protein
MKRESESEEKNKAAITMPISMSKEREQKWRVFVRFFWVQSQKSFIHFHFLKLRKNSPLETFLALKVQEFRFNFIYFFYD